jgi:outer membrane protein
MQRSRTLVSVYVLLLSSVISLGQAPASLPQPVYVSVAFNSAVLQTTEAQRIFRDLQVKFAPRQTHLQELNAKVESLKKQINDNSASLSEADKAAKLHDLDSEERQLQRETDDYKSDTDSASQQAFQSVAQKLYTFLQDYAKQHAYTLVIDRGSEAAPVVWYAASNADITAELIKAYDLKAATPSGSSTKPGLPSAPTPH